jgi:pyruvyl transferase EpsO
METIVTKVKNTLNIDPRATLSRGYLRYRKARNQIALKHFWAQNNLAKGEAPAPFAPMRERIDELKKHINRDYCILDTPSHGNIGDHLIHVGELSFLNSLPHKKKYGSSLYTFNNSRISGNDLIVMHGGGNFGDIWHLHQKFREKIISSFKNNKIIIMPQTIFFNEDKNLKKAISVFSEHHNLTICTRDQRSYEIAVNNFTKNTVLLMPDMASYKKLGFVKRASETIRKVLFMKRTDKELKADYPLPYIKNIEIKDWPTFENNYFNYLPDKHTQSDFYLNEGIIFMANYDLVITTRLHGCILAALLGIPVIMVDNSYGKNRTYYETWLSQMPNCYLANNQNEVEQLVHNNFPEVTS